jgi:hypothetical protein
MQKTSCLAVLFTMCMFAAESLAQPIAQKTGPNAVSLCVLQKKVVEGEHETVRVFGIYGPGLDHTVLEDAECPSESTWVELALRSQKNKEGLRKMLDRSRRAYVVLEGEFYGPPVPDPKLPEAIRKSYHPGWGHLAAFKTKLVVHAIREVKAAPPEQSDDSFLSQPPTDLRLEHADVPFYPPMARIADITGTVQIEVTIKNGVMAITEVKSPAPPILVNATLENLKTWKFASDANAAFRITYIYEVEREGTASPGNPRIEMQLPNLIKITAQPPKTTSNYQLGAVVGGSDTVDEKTGDLHPAIP